MILIIHRKKEQIPECTYTTFLSGEDEATAEKPILILDNQKCSGRIIPAGYLPIRFIELLLNLKKKRQLSSADIRKVDSRFVSLIRWLGENRINVRLSGENRTEGYCVYGIREIAFGGERKFVLRRTAFFNT